MTVKELIEQLKQFPEDAEVWRKDYEHNLEQVEEITNKTVFGYTFKGLNNERIPSVDY